MSQRPSAPDPVFELAARKSARRRAYDARCTELQQRQDDVTARLYAAAHYRVIATLTDAEFARGWASTFVDAAGTLTETNLWQLVEDDPNETWIPRRLAYAALRAARHGLDAATGAAERIVADTEHRGGVRSALDDLIVKASQALRVTHEAILRDEYPEEAPPVKYDPCEREPETFEELCQFAAFWACLARPDFDSKGRAPASVTDPDHHFIEMYCKATFGEMSVSALSKLRDQYAVRTGKGVDEIDATSLEDLANHFRPESANSQDADTPLASPLLRLTSLLTNGVSDEKILQAVQMLDEKLTLEEKLTRLHRLVCIPVTAPASKLAKLFGVSKTAIIDSKWWEQNRRGRKEEEVGRREALHRERAARHDS